MQGEHAPKRKRGKKARTGIAQAMSWVMVCRASSGGVHKFNTCSKLNNTKNGSIKSKGSINGLGSGQGPRTEGGGKFALQGNLEALNRQGYGIMARSLVSS